MRFAICKEEDVGGEVSVPTDEKRVFWTEISLSR